MEYGYARVSSKDQNIDRQMNAMKQYHTDNKRCSLYKIYRSFRMTS